MMRSALPPEEFDMEKNVVLEEIAMSNDQLEQLAYHMLHEKAYTNAPMAWPVLGYESTLKNLTRDQMHDYFQRRYAPDNLALIVAGNVAPAKVIDAAQRLTAGWEPANGTKAVRRTPPPVSTGTVVQRIERFNQQAILLAYPAAPATDDASEEAAAMASILGGENSRFYWNIVQAGIAPRASVWHEDYEDCGLMILYGLGEPGQAERLTEALRREAEQIARNGVEQREVERVRNKRRTSLAAEGEAPYYRLLQIMDDFDYRGRPRTVEERLDRAARITADSLAAYLERFPITGESQFVSAGPRDWPVV
jgi:predicted Zn-dependent peptidase